MSAQIQNIETIETKATAVEQEVEVLYQKLGAKWFAFSVIDGDVFMSPVSEETIKEVRGETKAPSENRGEYQASASRSKKRSTSGVGNDSSAAA